MWRIPCSTLVSGWQMQKVDPHMTAVVNPTTAAAPAVPETPFKRFTRNYFASKIATVGFVMLVIILLDALFAPWLSPQDPYDLSRLDVMDSRMKPGANSAASKIITSITKPTVAILLEK